MKTGKSLRLVIAGVVGALVLTACGGYKSEIRVIQANQTAFLIPVNVEASQQVKLQSIDFLKNKQVALKQVTIPYEWRQTGATLGVFPTGDWYAAAKLIVVDRSLITREWTKAANTGTAGVDQAFGVESSESVDFKVGATATASIEEADAATYLYYYGDKPLPEVMDQNIRGFIQQELFNEFGARTLAQGQGDKRLIFETVRDRLVKAFKERGITILSFGGSEGMIYTDPKIQAVISDNYTAQQKVIQAQALATQQGYDNARLISQAVAQSQAQATQQGYDNARLIAQANAQATATVVAGYAGADVMRQNGQAIQQYPGLTAYLQAQKSTGQVPQFLVIGADGANNLPFSFFVQPPPMPTGTPIPTGTAVGPVR